MATMEQKLKSFIEEWQGKFMNEYLQPTLETQYDKIRQSLNRKLHQTKDTRKPVNDM